MLAYDKKQIGRSHRILIPAVIYGGCAVGKDGYHHGRLWSVRTPGSGKGPELCL